ncbi:hypothetical protein BT69DRAFT_177975 [Atractiella rhizophila]|nr:hypothetical protein BT69DRAFT_177975 [Atractiella rhizophila]
MITMEGDHLPTTTSNSTCTPTSHPIPSLVPTEVVMSSPPPPPLSPTSAAQHQQPTKRSSRSSRKRTSSGGPNFIHDPVTLSSPSTNAIPFGATTTAATATRGGGGTINQRLSAILSPRFFGSSSSSSATTPNAAPNSTLTAASTSASASTSSSTPSTSTYHPPPTQASSNYPPPSPSLAHLQNQPFVPLQPATFLGAGGGGRSRGMRFPSFGLPINSSNHTSNSNSNLNLNSNANAAANASQNVIDPQLQMHLPPHTPTANTVAAEGDVGQGQDMCMGGVGGMGMMGSAKAKRRPLWRMGLNSLGLATGERFKSRTRSCTIALQTTSKLVFVTSFQISTKPTFPIRPTGPTDAGRHLLHRHQDLLPPLSILPQRRNHRNDELVLKASAISLRTK